MIFPDKPTFSALAKRFNRIPIYREMNIDEPGMLLMLKVLSEKNDVIFLESLGKNSSNTRFSYLGIRPRHSLSLQSGAVYRNDSMISPRGEDLFIHLRNAIEEFATPVFEKFGTYSGGYTGYFGYEAVNYCGTLRKKISESENVPQAYLLMIDDFICHDNLTGKYYIASCAYPQQESGCYDTVCDYLLALETEIIAEISKTTLPYIPLRADHVEQEFCESKEDFMEKVRRVKEQIYAGEALQVVLSMRAMIGSDVDPYLFYLRLRKLNPSPYMFYFNTDKFTIVGSSPEVHVKTEGRRATLKPIAGTIKRVDDEKTNLENRKKLLGDPKERAEHLMLVDLARNDLSRIAIAESVEVESFMQPEDYSHVIHLVSLVTSELAPEKNIIDVLRESFPAGTVSGAPKVRAIEIIDEHETIARGMYAGALGYIGFNGNMDTCITIRTAYFTPEGNYLQAGAGIVQDSIPENEYLEICSKLRALAISAPFALKA